MNNLNLELELNGRLNKHKCNTLAHTVAFNPEFKNSLLSCLMHQNEDISKSAVWVLSHVHDYNKKYFKDDLELLIQLVCDSTLDTILRCTLRLLQDYQIPENLQGSLITRCFDLLVDHNVPVAIKAFSMTVVANHCNQYPELKPELKMVIEELLTNPTPGILSRGSKILKRIS
ncbi:MAG: hypothetical protein OCD76_01735 [Reichenbachiella sp.]